MSYNTSKGISEGFVLPGSKPQFPPSLKFNIEYMVLTIEPALKNNTKNLVNCNQKLVIKTLQELGEIELDIAELKIHNVSLSHNLNNDSKNNIENPIINEELKFDTNSKEDKLIIKLLEVVKKGKVITININYSAGYNQETNEIKNVRSGFHFLSLKNKNQDQKYQAWTQGETLESRYWFPCLDDPKVKFKREIHIMVPEKYEVISNGTLESKNKVSSKEGIDYKQDSKVEWIWKENNPNPAYLTSIVIGEFVNKKEDYIKLPLLNGSNSKEKIPLLYYWTNDVEQKGYDPMLTYRDTSNVIRFFEEYLQTNYPYHKYSQVAVDDFDFGGMENTSCTTLTKDFFHDIHVLPDYTFDVEVVRHEIVHQWFGDLVTCRDWQHLWLNEGFATYFTILYLDKEHIQSPPEHKNRNEFYYSLLLKMDEYLSSSTIYKRPIVTNIYKHPDDLFDDHAYEKGGCVLHMLRNYIGEENFRQSLKVYLDKFKYKSAETDDLRKIFEEVSGTSLQQFFDQWLYKAGHPLLKIKISFKKSNDKFMISLNIQQVNDEKTTNTKEELVEENEAFSFPLDFKLYLLNDKKYRTEVYTFSINNNSNDFIIEFDESKMKDLKFISIDPQLKLLKVIKSIEIEENSYDFNLSKMLRYQLKDGDTIIERIDAARFIAKEKEISNDTLDALSESIINENEFYGVSISAARTLGSFNKNKIVASKAYKRLKVFFEEQNQRFNYLDSRIKNAIVVALGNYEKKESLPIFLEMLHNNNVFISASAIFAIGKIVKSKEFSEKEKRDHINLLISIVEKEINGNISFGNRKARNAISGLGEFSKESDSQIRKDVADFLIECGKPEKDYLIRRAAVQNLGKFLSYNVEKDGIVVKREVNTKVLDLLKRVLRTDRWGLQNDVCQALVEIEVKKPDIELIETLNELTWIAEHDPDGWVRREAEISINDIRKWIKKWLDEPPEIHYKIRKGAMELREEEIEKRRSIVKYY